FGSRGFACCGEPPELPDPARLRPEQRSGDVGWVSLRLEQDGCSFCPPDSGVAVRGAWGYRPVDDRPNLRGPHGPGGVVLPPGPTDVRVTLRGCPPGLNNTAAPSVPRPEPWRFGESRDTRRPMPLRTSACATDPAPCSASPARYVHSPTAKVYDDTAQAVRT